MSRRSGAGVGAPTIVLLVVVLCVTVFGTLALQSARQDALLTRRTQQAAQAWYAADAQAQQLLCAADEALLRGETLPPALSGQAGGELTYTVPVDDARELRVTLDSASGRCVVLSWRTCPTGDWAADAQLDLYQGEDDTWK